MPPWERGRLKSHAGGEYMISKTLVGNFSDEALGSNFKSKPKGRPFLVCTSGREFPHLAAFIFLGFFPKNNEFCDLS